jgi:YD repeat-containing protein
MTAITAVTQTNGSVLIRYGALPRVFERQPDGGYRATTGDLGALSVVSGVFELREGDGTRERFRADGRLDFTEDANGYRITVAYSGTRVSGYAETRGESAAYIWNAHGRISQMTDAAGRVTTFGYDSDGDHLLSISSPRGSYAFSYVTGQGAAREHAVASITYPDGLVMRMAYDADGRLAAEGVAQSPVGAMAEAITYTWARANEMSTLNAAGARSTWTALDHGGLAQVIDPLGVRARIRFDANGNPIEATGPDNARTRLAWDARGNPAGITDPLGRALGLSVEDAWNELTALRDPRGALTTLEQDSRGNLTAIGRADGSRTEFTLDTRGLVTATTNRRGRTTRYDYDSLGALVRRVSPDGSQVTYAWDATAT